MNLNEQRIPCYQCVHNDSEMPVIEAPCRQVLEHRVKVNRNRVDLGIKFDFHPENRNQVRLILDARILTRHVIEHNVLQTFETKRELITGDNTSDSPFDDASKLRQPTLHKFRMRRLLVLNTLHTTRNRFIARIIGLRRRNNRWRLALGHIVPLHRTAT